MAFLNHFLLYFDIALCFTDYSIYFPQRLVLYFPVVKTIQMDYNPVIVYSKINLICFGKHLLVLQLEEMCVQS